VKVLSLELSAALYSSLSLTLPQSRLVRKAEELYADVKEKKWREVTRSARLRYLVRLALAIFRALSRFVTHSARRSSRENSPISRSRCGRLSYARRKEWPNLPIAALYAFRAACTRALVPALCLYQN
jgi:hypothetical protein